MLYKLPFIFILILIPALLAFLLTPSAFAKNSSSNYIVVLNENIDTDQALDDISKKIGIEVDQKYKHVLKGFSASISNSKLEKIKNDPRVKQVVEDKEVNAFVRSVHKNTIYNSQTQIIPTGVSRIGDGVSMTNNGSGVAVAVLDTGIDLTHPDLAANIIASKSCIKGRSGNDDNGHGSHVAGTIAGINNSFGIFGVASQAKLIAVKVLDFRGSGSWSSVICGLDWVSGNASRYNIKVANVSLGGSGSSDNNCGQTDGDVLHQAICRSKDAGVTFVVAAGNSGGNAANFVPAAYDDAVITVSALADSDGKSGGTGAATSYGADDTFASFSNYGSVVDLAAPGVSIYSTYKKGGYATLSGTSMATPHVTGAAAMYIKNNPSASWTQVRDALKSTGEALGNGHTDPSSKHPEPVILVNTF